MPRPTSLLLIAVVLVFTTSPPMQAQSLDPPVRALIMPVPVATHSVGTVTALTYNVAGIPRFVSRRPTDINNALIGPLLNDFELVLLQEDFLYHAELSAGVQHPARSTPSREVPSVLSLGDGLNRFSRYSFSGFEREPWAACFGVLTAQSDCTATKGFSAARTALAEDVVVDVYNLHLDAGGTDGDRAARGAQIDQLIEAVQRRSPGRAVIIAGDTNLSRNPDDQASLDRLLRELGLADACRELACGRERVDRVLYRSGHQVGLVALSYDTPSGFVDAAGDALSDHRPVAVTFAWRRLADRVAER